MVKNFTNLNTTTTSNILNFEFEENIKPNKKNSGDLNFSSLVDRVQKNFSESRNNLTQKSNQDVIEKNKISDNLTYKSNLDYKNNYYSNVDNKNIAKKQNQNKMDNLEVEIKENNENDNLQSTNNEDETQQNNISNNVAVSENNVFFIESIENTDSLIYDKINENIEIVDTIENNPQDYNPENNTTNINNYIQSDINDDKNLNNISENSIYEIEPSLDGLIVKTDIKSPDMTNNNLEPNINESQENINPNLVKKKEQNENLNVTELDKDYFDFNIDDCDIENLDFKLKSETNETQDEILNLNTNNDKISKDNKSVLYNKAENIFNSNILNLDNQNKKTEKPEKINIETFNELNAKILKIENNNETNLQNQNMNDEIIKQNITNINNTNLSETKLNNMSFESRVNNYAQNKTADINKENIFNQITTKLENTKFENKINIILKPQHLGKLHLEISNTKDGIVANIVASNVQVKDLLEKNIDGLKNNLSTQGLNVNSVNIKVESTNQTANSGLNYSSENFDGNLNQQFNSKNGNGNLYQQKINYEKDYDKYKPEEIDIDIKKEENKKSLINQDRLVDLKI